jgi:hypothetical protein
MDKLESFSIERGSRARLLPHLRLIVCVIAAVFAILAAGNAFGQTRESATAGRTFLWVGGGGSGYYLQYGQSKNLGITGYVDADTVRRFGIEAEGRWLMFHETNDIHAETYLAGPRYHFNVGRFQPYVKGMAGIGKFTFTYNYAHGTYFVVGPGAGLDYRILPRLSVRADGEYQYWPNFTFGAMSSGGISVGLRYLVLQ